MNLHRSIITNFSTQHRSTCVVAFGLIVVLCGRLQSQEGRLRPTRLTHTSSVLENASAGTTFDELQNVFPHLSRFEMVPEDRELPIRVTRDGELQVSNPELLNYEQRSLWVLTIRATRPREEDPFLADFIQSLEGQGDATISQQLAKLRTEDVILSVRVHLVDQDETPVLADTSFTLRQNNASEMAGRITPIESDRSDELHYALTCSTSPDCFEIDSQTGVITLRNVEHFDWTRPQQAMEVEVRDRRGNSSRAVLEFNVVATPPADSDDRSADAVVEIPDLQLIDMLPDAGGETAVPVPIPDVSVAEHSKELSPRSTESQTVNSDYHHLTGRRLESSAQSVDPTTVPDVTSEEVAAAPQVDVTIPNTDIDFTADDGKTLDDAARNILAATSSGIALNGSVESNGSPAVVPNQTVVLRTLPDEDAEAANQRFIRRSPIQTLLFFSALATISVAVFLHYKRARQARLEAMKPTIEEADARLDQYMAAQTKAQQPTEASQEPASEAKPAKVVAERPTIDDPDAAFDPESLIDDEMLEASLFSANDRAAAGASSDANSLELTLPSLAGSDRETAKSQAGSLLLMNEDLLADEILAPATIPSEQSLAAAREQLKEINARLEDRVLSATSEPPLDSELNFQDTRDWLPTDGQSNSTAGSETVMEDHATSVIVTEETHEPSYELIWDPEIQRYVKVERAIPVDPVQNDTAALDTIEDADNSTTQEFVLPSASSHSKEHESTEYAPEEPPSDRVQSLRAELADLFNLHAATTAQARQPVAESIESAESPAPQTAEKSSEENHLDSVAKYLSQLLERSKKDEGSDIFIDRRKSQSGVWDGDDRRKRPKPATKSYIETYLEQHGGQLEADMASLKKPAPVENSEPDEPAAPPRERKPVDVPMLRRHMESFRAVAERSVETAIATYQVRTAKGRLVSRSMLIGGLVVILGLGIGTNVFRRFHLQPLNWLMCAFILLCVAEFFLRVDSIRQHRREMRLRILSAQRPAAKPVSEPEVSQPPSEG